MDTTRKAATRTKQLRSESGPEEAIEQVITRTFETLGRSMNNVVLFPFGITKIELQFSLKWGADIKLLVEGPVLRS